MQMSVGIKEKGSSSIIMKKRRWRGREAGGVHHLGRVTAWPQAHWEGLWQRRDTGDAGGTLSPFVTAAPMKTAAPLSSLHLPPLSKPASTLSLMFHPFPMWLPPPPRLYSPLWPPSFHPLFLSFSYSPSWLHTSDPLNRFSLSILKVCRLPVISQSLSALLSTPESDLPSLPSSSSSSSQPHSFPFAESPLISIRLPSARERWKSILPPATATLWLRRKGRQLAGL